MTAARRIARTVAGLLRAEPTLGPGFVVLLDLVLLLAGAPKPVVIAVTGFVGPLLLAVRKVVTPVDTAARAAVDTAVAAASEAVARLDSSSAGDVGELTGQGMEAIAASVEDAVAIVLDPAGLNPKGRKVVVQ